MRSVALICQKRRKYATNHCDWTRNIKFPLIGGGALQQQWTNDRRQTLLAGLAFTGLWLDMVSLRPFLATDWPVPPGSGLFGLFLLFRFLSGGDLLGAVQERAQCHPAEHIAMRLLNELHQLADVAVQTLRRKRAAKQVRVRESDYVWTRKCVRGRKRQRKLILLCSLHQTARVFAYMHKGVTYTSVLEFVEAPGTACEWVASDSVPW